MNYITKEFIALFISFWLFMLAALCQWIWGWPTEQHLFYASAIWLIAACISGVYGWHLENKDEV
jgi:hypothetical protein